MESEKLIFYTDGASQGNPGESGVGIVMCDSNNQKIQTFRKYIGSTTNNVAEYVAFIMGMQEAVKARVKDVQFYSDSELLVRQVQGIYKVRDDRLKQLYAIFENLKDYFNNFSIEHIDREKNKEADKLATQAIKEKK